VKALSPTPERRRHGNIRRSPVIADAGGSIGHPWHCRSLLDNLLAKSEITPPEHTAGCQFHELAVKAQISPLKAADVLRPRGNATRNYLGSDAAQRQIGLALDALGGLDTPMGSLAWDVLGLDHSLSEWSLRQRWTGKGRQTAAAKGVLLSALPILAQHFGLTRPAIAR
jgi:hypothetical protein